MALFPVTLSLGISSHLVIMVWHYQVPFHYTSLPRTGCVMLGGRKCTIGYLATWPSGCLPTYILIWEVWAEVLGCFERPLPVNKFIIGVPHCLRSLQQVGSPIPTLHSQAFLPLHQASIISFAMPQRYSGWIVTLYSHEHLALAMSVSLLHQIGYCYCSCVIYLEGDYFCPGLILKLLTDFLDCLDFEQVDMGFPDLVISFEGEVMRLP